MTACAFFRRSLTVAAILAAAGCERPASHARAGVPATIGVSAGDIPSGDLAGAAQSDIGARIDNPFEGQPEAAAQGKTLFAQMNCAGCHGYGLGGAMGPNLTDRYWRYGGTPGAIYQSIAGGRPQGMPAWRRALPPDDIWRLVSYIESYGGTTPTADYQAGQQGDVAALPVTPNGEAASTKPTPSATGKLAHP